MNDPLGWLDEVERRRAEAGLNRRVATFGAGRPGRIQLEDRELINFASNDYLGLADDPRVIEAACEAVKAFGWGAGASPLVCGWREPHETLAHELAEFEATERVVIFPSGFAANAGAIAALVGPGDAVFHDRLNHASLIAGSRMSGAEIRVFPHRDSEHLARGLGRHRGRFRRVLIATDGIFSMDGDLAPVDQLVDVAERYDAILLVDEAHATLTCGPGGRGAAAECGVEDRVPVRTGTLSKALGSLGGFVAGSHSLVNQVLNAAPTFVYSTALPPAASVAASAALRIARSEPWRQQRLRELAEALRDGLRGTRFEVEDHASPIIPLMVGNTTEAVAIAERLRDLGFLVPAIRPPTVPRGTSRLRVSLCSAHSIEDVRHLASSLASLVGGSHRGAPPV